jgi:hypothetical protein
MLTYKKVWMNFRTIITMYPNNEYRKKLINVVSLGGTRDATEVGWNRRYFAMMVCKAT